MPAEFCPHCMQTLSPGELFCPRCGREADQQAAPYQLPIGTVLRTDKGHVFLFGEAKGGGGFGLTYIARELSSGKIVAIKEYFPGNCQPQRRQDLSVVPTTAMQDTYRRGMKSFLSEASMLQAVRDIPSIVHVMDYFEANQTAYMVMEYLDGTTLEDLLKRQPRLEPDSLLRKTLPLMRDLERLHAAGVVHRDIAPDNIMLMPDGSLTLLDFGCARSMEDGKAMTVVLKPGFAPVEQYQTLGQGGYTDVYALCATLYFCLTGQTPPPSPVRLTDVFDGRPDPLEPPSALGAALSSEQEKLLLWGLAIQPKDRPQSMAQLADALEAALPPRTTVLPGDPGERREDGGDGVPSKLRLFWQRYGLKLLLAAAGVVILILTILLLAE